MANSEGLSAAHSVAAVTVSVLQQRVDHLLACIQPNAPSERRRLTIASYVCDLISRCFAPQRQVEAFTFGSVPLRTYLPDGDLDISIFTVLQGSSDGLKHTWASQLMRGLEKEATRHDAPFRICNCQVIQAEVKLVKCMVADVVVDVSFNAVGGLCTVVFLEWVDRTIGRGHLFKRSIVLVKAWCYYESRLLGAHHGLISSYALESMVLYVFNLHGAALASPLEVLQRFLEVFSEFDWDSYCLSIVGPIPLASFPNPKIAQDAVLDRPLLLDHVELRNAVEKCSVRPSEAVAALDQLMHCRAQPTEEEAGRATRSGPLGDGAPVGPTPHTTWTPFPFPLKYLNIMDPLLPMNNLGRSVSKASFSRIRAALSYGATSLSRLLRLDPQAASEGIDSYFKNTWRSPTRMAADNQVFQSRLARGGTAWLPERTPSAPSTDHVQGGLGVPTGSTNCGSMGRRHSSISLPEIITDRSPFDDPDAADSLEVHDGRSPLQPSLRPLDGRPAPLPPLSHTASARVDHMRSMSDMVQSRWHTSSSQPTSPSLSPRMGGPAAIADSRSPIRPEVVTMTLDRRDSNETNNGSEDTDNGDEFDVELELKNGIEAKGNATADSSVEQRTAPKADVRESLSLPSSQGAKVHTVMAGRDIFAADMDAVTRNLAIARRCQASGGTGNGDAALNVTVAGVPKDSSSAENQGADAIVPPFERLGILNVNSCRGQASMEDDGFSAGVGMVPSLRIAPLEVGSYATGTEQGISAENAGSGSGYGGRNDLATASVASSVANTQALARSGTAGPSLQKPCLQRPGPPSGWGGPSLGQRQNPKSKNNISLPSSCVTAPTPAEAASRVQARQRRARGHSEPTGAPNIPVEDPHRPSNTAVEYEASTMTSSSWSSVASKPPSRLGPRAHPNLVQQQWPQDKSIDCAPNECSAGNSANSTPSFATLASKKASSLSLSVPEYGSGGSTSKCSTPKVGGWATSAGSSPKGRPKPTPGATDAVIGEANTRLFKDISFKLEGEEFPSLSAALPSRDSV